jgi:hypothetical protein
MQGMLIELRHWTCGLVLSVVSIHSVYAAQTDTKDLKTALGVQSTIQKADQGSQKAINQLHEQTISLLDRYKRTAQERESLTAYNDQVAKMIVSQEEEIASLHAQIATIDQTGRDIVPFILRMTEALESFVALDTPFLLEERKTRLLELRDMLDRADITVSEKYRRVMETYQIESDYGRTIEAYTSKLGERTVDFLRIGRISLMYRSLDRQEVGQWNAQTSQWEVLGDEYQAALDRGLKIARKQAPPELLALPIQAAEVK